MVWPLILARPVLNAAPALTGALLTILILALLALLVVRLLALLATVRLILSHEVNPSG